jgi:hypothetical protein
MLMATTSRTADESVHVLRSSRKRPACTSGQLECVCSNYRQLFSWGTYKEVDQGRQEVKGYCASAVRFVQLSVVRRFAGPENTLSEGTHLQL